MNICFIMYPWDRVEADTDTTLRIIHEAFFRGHNVGIMVPSNLTIRENEVLGFVKIINPIEKTPSDPAKFYSKVTFSEKLLPMAGFDAIFLRANPPVDNIMLNFLDSIKNDVFILNDVDGIRKSNNKIYSATMFDNSQGIIPQTHVSKNKDYLMRIIKETNQEKMILKPLDGYGGSGVILLETKAEKSINSLLDFYINGQQKNQPKYVILQEYIEGADEGDVRVLMLNGIAIGAMKRIPAENEARANVSTGGTVVKHVLSKQEKLICELVGPKLVADGLHFVGLDIIKGKLIEINVLSPGGITRINKLNRVKLQEKVIDFIEQIVMNNSKALSKKLANRSAVEDAKS